MCIKILKKCVYNIFIFKDIYVYICIQIETACNYQLRVSGSPFQFPFPTIVASPETPGPLASPWETWQVEVRTTIATLPGCLKTYWLMNPLLLLEEGKGTWTLRYRSFTQQNGELRCQLHWNYSSPHSKLKVHTIDIAPAISWDLFLNPGINHRFCNMIWDGPPWCQPLAQKKLVKNHPSQTACLLEVIPDRNQVAETRVCQSNIYQEFQPN